MLGLYLQSDLFKHPINQVAKKALALFFFVYTIKKENPLVSFLLCFTSIFLLGKNI